MRMRAYYSVALLGLFTYAVSGCSNGSESKGKAEKASSNAKKNESDDTDDSADDDEDPAPPPKSPRKTTTLPPTDDTPAAPSSTATATATASATATATGTATGTAASTSSGTGTGTSAIVEFHIKAGTGSQPWNTAATMLTAKVGQTIRLVNDDTIAHYLHTGGAPCPHGTAAFKPGATYDCVAAKAIDPAATKTPATYDHTAGPTSSFFLKVVP